MWRWGAGWIYIEPLQVRSIHPDDLVEVLLAGLDESNCVDVLNHEVLRKYPEFEAGRF